MSSPIEAGNAPNVRDEPVIEEHWRGPSWTVRLIILGLVAIAVAAVGLLGGLERAPDPVQAQVPTLPVNDSIDAGPWRVGVTNAAASLDLGLYKPRTEGNYLLSVAVRVEILNYRSSSGETEKIARLPDFAGLTAPEPLDVALIRDGSRLDHLNPGLPERVAYIFEVKAGTPVPSSVVVELRGWTAQRSLLEGTLQWIDEGPRARVTVPVVDRTKDVAPTPTVTR